MVCVTLVAMVACSASPELLVDNGVPDDVEQLAGDVWEEFSDAVDHIGSCVGSVRLAVDSGLDDRARYVPDEAKVVLRIPATAARLRQSLLHEFTHHLDYSCLEDSDVRDDFKRAVGMTDVPWFSPEAAEDAPFELFADSVSIVLQRDEFVRARALPGEALDFVEDWLGDGDSGG